MANPIPFVLAGVVVSWDPVPRILYVGSARLVVAPGVGVEALVPSQRVTVTGHKSKQDGGPWGGDEDRSASARVLTSAPFGARKIPPSISIPPLSGCGRSASTAFSGALSMRKSTDLPLSRFRPLDRLA